MDAGDGVCPGIVFVDRGFSFFVIFAASARFDIAVMRSIWLILDFSEIYSIPEGIRRGKESRCRSK